MDTKAKLDSIAYHLARNVREAHPNVTAETAIDYGRNLAAALVDGVDPRGYSGAHITADEIAAGIHKRRADFPDEYAVIPADKVAGLALRLWNTIQDRTK